MVYSSYKHKNSDLFLLPHRENSNGYGAPHQADSHFVAPVTGYGTYSDSGADSAAGKSQAVALASAMLALIGSRFI